MQICRVRSWQAGGQALGQGKEGEREKRRWVEIVKIIKINVKDLIATNENVCEF